MTDTFKSSLEKHRRKKGAFFPEPAGETEYLCRGCAGTEFRVETYWVLNKVVHQREHFRRYQTEECSGALICTTCGHSVRIDISTSVKLPTKKELAQKND